jgi:hypothetical protein
MMENDLTNSLRKLYSSVTGNQNVMSKDVCLEFSRMPITKPLVHNSDLYGKLPTRGHILEGEIPEDSIEKLLADIRNQT